MSTLVLSSELSRFFLGDIQRSTKSSFMAPANTLATERTPKAASAVFTIEPPCNSDVRKTLVVLQVEGALLFGSLSLLDEGTEAIDTKDGPNTTEDHSNDERVVG